MLTITDATFLYRYTVRHEFFLLEGRLLAIEHLTSATCRMLSSQMSGYGRIIDKLMADCFIVQSFRVNTLGTFSSQFVPCY